MTGKLISKTDKKSPSERADIASPLSVENLIENFRKSRIWRAEPKTVFERVSRPPGRRSAPGPSAWDLGAAEKPPAGIASLMLLGSAAILVQATFASFDCPEHQPTELRYSLDVG